MKIKTNDIIIIFLMIIFTLLLLFTPYDSFRQTTQIQILSIFGLVELILIYYTGYLKTKKIFTLYNIFIAFYFLFNYGQCLMWALNIHSGHEIGKWWVYIYNAASPALIIRTQKYILRSALFFHIGALICAFVKKEPQQKVVKNELGYKANYILAFITIPCMFYNVIHNLIVSLSHGYSAIYYGEYAYTGNSLLIIIGGMGFACLIGLLFNSNFDKKVVKWVFIIFGLYTLLDLLSGDRGGFIFKLLLLFYLYNTYYKKINIRRFISYCLLAFFSLYVIYAIKEIRNTGISIQTIIKAIDLKNNPLVKAVFEMGFSMNILIVLLSKNVMYPFGNTYVNAIIGMPTAHIVELLRPGYVGVSEWFSQGYLNINYGAGFSIIGETYINYGYYGGFIAQFILGFFVYWLIMVGFKSLSSNNRLVLGVVATNFLIPLCRNSFQIFAKNFFYGAIIYFILIVLIQNYLKKRGDV